MSRGLFLAALAAQYGRPAPVAGALPWALATLCWAPNLLQALSFGVGAITAARERSPCALSTAAAGLSARLFSAAHWHGVPSGPIGADSCLCRVCRARGSPAPFTPHPSPLTLPHPSPRLTPHSTSRLSLTPRAGRAGVALTFVYGLLMGLLHEGCARNPGRAPH